MLKYHMVQGTASDFARMMRAMEMESALDNEMLYALAVDAHNRTSSGIFGSHVKPERLGATLHEHARCASEGYYLDRFKVKVFCTHCLVLRHDLYGVHVLYRRA